MTEPATRAERRALQRAKAERILTPTTRRWAYGVTAAALAVVVGVGWLPPSVLPVLLPLAMAIFYVTENGDPR